MIIDANVAVLAPPSTAIINTRLLELIWSFHMIAAGRSEK